MFEEGQRMLINNPARFDGVRVIGVDEHCWRLTRRGEKYVTGIIDLTPAREGAGPARLLDMVQGRSKEVFKAWLADRPQVWRDQIEGVAMDAFTGYKTTAAKELRHATAVMHPFHVVRLEALVADDQHVEVEATCSIYQRLVLAYQQPDKKFGRYLLGKVINDINTGVPEALVGLRRLGRTLNRRAADVLPFFDRPGNSHGPAEAINGRLEHLRGIALGFRNLPTTAPAASSKPAASNRNYTLVCEEPIIGVPVRPVPLVLTWSAQLLA